MLAPGMYEWLWTKVPRHYCFKLKKDDTLYFFTRDYNNRFNIYIERFKIKERKSSEWIFKEEIAYKIIKTLMKKKGYEEDDI